MELRATIEANAPRFRRSEPQASGQTPYTELEATIEANAPRFRRSEPKASGQPP